MLESLGLNRSILVGHSLGGAELSSIGIRYPERVASLQDEKETSPEERHKLHELDGLTPPFRKGLRDRCRSGELRGDPRVGDSGCRITTPEAEWRQQFKANRDGSVGELRIRSAGDRAISAGRQKYTKIRAPILAIYAGDAGPEIPSARTVRYPGANQYVFLSNEADVLTRDSQPY